MLYRRTLSRFACYLPSKTASAVAGWTLAALLAGIQPVPALHAQGPHAPVPASAETVPQGHLIEPVALVRLLKGAPEEKPMILQVGPRVMFAQAHIPGAEYAGPASQASGVQSLESVVSGLPKERQIILYCGCCPWDRCPNVGPAYKRLAQLGFKHVRVLHLAGNFGDDWVNKGYPAVKGK